MFIERYLTEVLTKQFGHILENVDPDQVRVSAWNGEIVLRDVIIRKHALDSILSTDCPVEILSGRIGSLDLRIPWKLVRSQFIFSYWKDNTEQEQHSNSSENSKNCCSLVLKDVNILITPKRRLQKIQTQDNNHDSNDNSVTSQDYDSNSSSQQKRDLKRAAREQKIQAKLDAHLLKLFTQTSGGNDDEKIDNTTQKKGYQLKWVQDSVTSLLSNLSIRIENVHLRYEDPGTSMGFTWTKPSSSLESEQLQRYRDPFAFGITLQQFSVQTVNNPLDEIKENESHTSSNIQQNLVAFQDLALYWDSSCSRLLADEEFIDSVAFEQLPQHTYLIHPVSPSIQIKCFPEPAPKVDDNTSDHSTKRISLNANTPPCTLSISVPPSEGMTITRSTLEDIAYIRKSLSVWSQATTGLLSETSLRRLAGLRPLTSPLDTPQLWWRYACEATIELQQSTYSEKCKYELQIKKSVKRQKGWLGLAQSLGRRRNYIHLYHIILDSSNIKKQRLDSLTELLDMEDRLFLEEIVAFRISAYKKRQIGTTSNAAEGKRGWSGWIPSMSNTPVKETTNDRTIEYVLTLEHRCAMFDETSLALQNEELTTRDSTRDISNNAWAKSSKIDDSGSLDSQNNLVLWKISFVCRDLSLQIVDQQSFISTGRSKHYEHQRQIRRAPIVRLSCVCVQELLLFEDFSWVLECSIASLAAKDMTGANYGDADTSDYPNLIGPKVGEESNEVVVLDDQSYSTSVRILIRRSVHWYRSQNDTKSNDHSLEMGTTTRTQIRLFPMEVIYSTVPVEALSRVLASFQTSELKDDYHRMASRAYKWKEVQKKRFLQALAHKEKKIIVDVDVRAPVLLIPESGKIRNSLQSKRKFFTKSDFSRNVPMLMIDLGRLQVFNGENTEKNAVNEYDDQWRLILSEVQCLSTFTKCVSDIHYPGNDGEVDNNEPTESSSYHRTQRVVEPFSLDFTILSKIVDDENSSHNNLTKVQVVATLPRLTFNLTSSAVRLVLRLKNQWKQQRNEKVMLQHNHVKFKKDSPSLNRKIEFRFSAPLITLRLENDVDGRDCKHICVDNNATLATRVNIRNYDDIDLSPKSTKIIDLALRGISCHIVQVSSKGSEKLNMDARLKSLDVVDLYQTAGSDYALLLSSLSPELLLGRAKRSVNMKKISWQNLLSEHSVPLDTDHDLVSVQYQSANNSEVKENDSQNYRATTNNSNCATYGILSDKDFDQNYSFEKNLPSEIPAEKLSICFHELYVEWNPETIAAIQKAMRLPRLEDGQEKMVQDEKMTDEDENIDEDEFFDAFEDNFFDASEIPMESPTSSILGRKPYSTHLISNSELNLSQSFTKKAMGNDTNTVKPENTHLIFRPYQIEFNLAKLRVNFNKESRHRRLITAEMDGTSVRYATLVSGGSKTVAIIGNLTFVDPASVRSETLYGQILGLKTDSSVRSAASLLEMEIVINPRKRKIVYFADDWEKEKKCFSKTDSVSVYFDGGCMKGFDSSFKARFSPMKFVFLQQLWMEIADYFFDGILGYEVWGNRRPPQQDQEKDLDFITKNSPEDNMNITSFTKFDIIMDTPVVLFPVAYCSSEFIRLHAASIRVSNNYSCDRIKIDNLKMNNNQAQQQPVQWFNNCTIDINDLRILNWSEKELSECQEPVLAVITLCWPTGPLAHLETPKWNVDCCIDSLAVTLRKRDYALLQNVVSYNIGEESRHLNEWIALQNISPEDLCRYNERVMVHYGYDKKDVAPTTYNVSITVPSISLYFAEGDEGKREIAVARCTNLKWGLTKLKDRVTRQKLSCDVVLENPTAELQSETTMLSPFHRNEPSTDCKNIEFDDMNSKENRSPPEVTYTSTSQPNGDNVKTLEIVDACIYMVYPSWRDLATFFQGLPEPSILTKEEVNLSVQVGDRWYRIGGSQSARPGHSYAIPNNSEHQQTIQLFDWIRNGAEQIDNTKHIPRRSSTLQTYRPSFQFRILLTSPCIIASSFKGHKSSIVLRLGHLDFLHHNNAMEGKICKSIFLHDLEVYASSNHNLRRNDYSGESSLIRPWCLVGRTEYSTDTRTGLSDKDFKESYSLQISADVLKARAAYSDMSVVLDVLLRLFSDSRPTNDAVKPQSSSRMNEETPDVTNSSTISEKSFPKPIKKIYAVEWDGFDILVTDDSGRHFAGTQELIELCLGKIYFLRKESYELQSTPSRNGLDSPTEFSWSDHMVYSTSLYLTSVDLFDYLQSETSPFRLAASSRSTIINFQRDDRNGGTENDNSYFNNPNLVNPRRQMKWKEFSLVSSKSWGFCAPTFFVERTNVYSNKMYNLSDQTDLIKLQSIVEGNSLRTYIIKLRSFTLQWNPSTVIALQRFLGRLLKQVRLKAVQVFNEDIGVIIGKSSATSKTNASTRSNKEESDFPVKAIFDIENLTLCLNKERQQRCLLQLNLSGSQVNLDRTKAGIDITGRVRDLSAWESNLPGSESATLKVNRNFLKVTEVERRKGGISLKHRKPGSDEHSDRSFLVFRYRTFEAKEPKRYVHGLDIPNWIKAHVSKEDSDVLEIDDYLEVSVAAIEFILLRERTEELLDYLSNGLPGKGMGATKRAAKGFLQKRIRTKSFLEVHVDAPTVVIPQHEMADSGIAMRLGDLDMSSWFEEGTLQGRIDQIDLDRIFSTISSSSSYRSSGGIGDENIEWWRFLSLSLSGLYGGRFQYRKNGILDMSASIQPIDLSIVLQKSTWNARTLSLRCKLSLVDMALAYLDYVLLRAILRDNLGRKIDTTKWENVEKAYWMEQEFSDIGSVDSGSGHPVPAIHTKPIAYSSNARHIRYGASSRKRTSTVDASADGTKKITAGTNKKPTALDFKFKFDGLSLMLRRNDLVDGVSGVDDETAAAFEYDMSLLKVQVVEVSISNKNEGDLSLHLSLFRIGLFDLGDRGRLVRERFAIMTNGNQNKSKIPEARMPCAFSVLIEGYSPSEKVDRAASDRIDGADDVDAQLVVNIDKCSASSVGTIGTLQEPIGENDDSKVTVTRVVINYLSVNALIRPFREILSFLSCSWPVPELQHQDLLKDRSGMHDTKASFHKDNNDSQSTPGSSLQLKLVAHYPRVFFIADESNPNSRALVLRGLAVVNAGRTTESFTDQIRDGTSKKQANLDDDVHSVTAVNAQLHSLESYINPDVDTTLRLRHRHIEMLGATMSKLSLPFSESEVTCDDVENDNHGIALLQPVTTGIEYLKRQRSRFPTKRFIGINMEPLSTMLSFEDLQLIESVLKRWSSGRNDISLESNRVTTEEQTPTDDLIETMDSYSPSSYDVVFSSQRLGLGLRKEGECVVVDEVRDHQHEDIIEVGDHILAIAGHKLQGSSLNSVVEQLSKATRPTTLTFTRSIKYDIHDVPITNAHDEKDVLQDDNNCCFTLVFKKGSPNGISFEKSIVRNVPVIKTVDQSVLNIAAVKSTGYASYGQYFNQCRFPRCGAVVVRVDECPSVDLNFAEVVHTIEESERPRSESSSVGKQGILSIDTYSITFLELDSSVWGNIDSFDLTASGADFTFIDDLKGRDMPILRGSLTAVEVHIQRGLGIETGILDPRTPFVLQKCATNLQCYSLVDAQSSFDDSIFRLSAIAKTKIDYYHPRIAVWEPLLEPAQLCFLLEWQASNILNQKPAQLAVEISDQVLRNQFYSRFGQRNKDVEASMLCLNCSDAAVEVLAKAVSEWKNWRETLLIAEFEKNIGDQNSRLSSNGNKDICPSSSGLDLINSKLYIEAKTVDNDSIYDSLQSDIDDDRSERRKESHTAKRIAAQTAALAALVFAKKRGAGQGGKIESSKPFIFRNRTGVSIAFVQQKRIAPYRRFAKQKEKAKLIMGQRLGEYKGLEVYDSSDITELADGEDAKFNMDLISCNAFVERDSSAGGKHVAKRVRKYEGQFRNLTVSIQALAGVFVEPIVDLEVSKAGSTVRQLSVRKDGAGIGVLSTGAQYSVPVVWKIEIVDNRRILTLSSAVRVVSHGFATSIEVGVATNSTLHLSSKTPALSNAASTIDTEEPFESSSVQLIGVARPNIPFYLPLWLALRLELVRIYIRPRPEGASSYLWGERCVLEFSPLRASPINSLLGSTSSSVDKWSWKETFTELESIRCKPVDNTDCTVWLSCYASSLLTRCRQDNPTRERRPKTAAFDRLKMIGESNEVLSVSVGAGLTLRNMIPISVEWEIAHQSDSVEVVDGSKLRHNTLHFSEDPFDSRATAANSALHTGECVDVFGCSFKTETLIARFRREDDKLWSTWESVSVANSSIEEESYINQDTDDTIGSKVPCTRQMNVQLQDDFGVPLTFGVRIVPKMAKVMLGESFNSLCFGVEVILYAELWICNLTSLPLCFGCPASQIHETKRSDMNLPESSGRAKAKFSAEAALFEIASVLELGEKGTGFKKERSNKENGDVYILPNQSCDSIVEEVFEYIQVENSMIERRWWASENLRDTRENIIAFERDQKNWRWIDDSWKVDCAGGLSIGLGGWESSRKLDFGSSGSFRGFRDFDPSHTFRRRRWFRERTTEDIEPIQNDSPKHKRKKSLLDGLQAFHQPVVDSFSIAQRQEQQRRRRKKGRKTGSKDEKNERKHNEDKNLDLIVDEEFLRISIKCNGGNWSKPTVLAPSGTCNGVARVFASRWSMLMNTPEFEFEAKSNRRNPKIRHEYASPTHGYAPLETDMYELCYSATDLDDEWGEFSRLMLVSARFLLRNDSSNICFEIKQSGTSDEKATRIAPGEIRPFYWADFRLPELISVRPCVRDLDGCNIYRWSGGFDACNLGMVAVRVRQSYTQSVFAGMNCQTHANDISFRWLRSIRALVEIRPGTGGTGINLSFKEEDPEGDGSLFRLENWSRFPIWLAQDGVLANPSTQFSTALSGRSERSKNERPVVNKKLACTDDESDGDCLGPMGQMSFALDVPFRQGKYVGRRAASMKELLRVRVGLAPLSSRAGVETTKVIGLLIVGETIYLKPSKLSKIISEKMRQSLYRIRVMGIMTVDGPTRVLKFFSMVKSNIESVFPDSILETVSYSSTNHSDINISNDNLKDCYRAIAKAGNETKQLLGSKKIFSEEEAKRRAFHSGNGDNGDGINDAAKKKQIVSLNQFFSFRAAFSGFIFSLIDTSPSEICTVSIKNCNVLARWDDLWTSSSLIVSVGWIQVDNHVPNAPFPVTVCPDNDISREDSGNITSSSTIDGSVSPLLVIGIAFMPRHKSGIVCLRSVTIALQNLAIKLDLAFLVRLQRYSAALQTHFNPRKNFDLRSFSSTLLEQRKSFLLPDIYEKAKEIEGAAATGVGRQKLYFGEFTILPCSIKLSVAPARALTPAQATLEGLETAAIHHAVRKGDVRFLGSSDVLDVQIGSKNTTPLSVVRGVFKSIFVDALLRLDGASLNFSGVFLRNQITSGPQLMTYLQAHYIASLRHNVPALLGSLAAFGNPLGLIRGLGDGVSDFVIEPVKGLKKSVEELDPSFLVDGVARGTVSLARHAVGGFADSASLLTETLSKNMTVLTLDRRYAQKRDRDNTLRVGVESVSFAGGVESGMHKLVEGFLDGVKGVVKAPIRGAERKGFEGFAKGVGKGLLGLLVKPIIGISDAATDVMIGVRSSVESSSGFQGGNRAQFQIRPRRTMYGRDKVMRSYDIEDAAAATLMIRTKIGGERYLTHLDMDDRLALLSIRRILIVGSQGEELLLLKFKHVSKIEVRQMEQADGSEGWGLIVLLNTPRKNGSEVEVICCKQRAQALDLCSRIRNGMNVAAGGAA